MKYSVKSLLELEETVGVSLYDLLDKAEITTSIWYWVLHFGGVDVFEYHKLSSQEKLLTDLKIQGEFTESIGMYRESEVLFHEEQEERPVPSSYKEGIMPLVYYAVAVMGVQDAMNYRPVDLLGMVDAFKQHMEFQFNLQEIALANIHGSMNNKHYRRIEPFPKPKVKKCSPEEREEVLEMIRKARG